MSSWSFAFCLRFQKQQWSHACTCIKTCACDQLQQRLIVRVKPHWLSAGPAHALLAAAKRTELSQRMQSALKRKLPGFVLKHDDLLEDQPLHDYGYVKEAALPLPGPSGEPL